MTDNTKNPTNITSETQRTQEKKMSLGENTRIRDYKNVNEEHQHKMMLLLMMMIKIQDNNFKCCGCAMSISYTKHTTYYQQLRDHSHLFTLFLNNL